MKRSQRIAVMLALALGAVGCWPSGCEIFGDDEIDWTGPEDTDYTEYYDECSSPDTCTYYNECLSSGGTIIGEFHCDDGKVCCEDGGGSDGDADSDGDGDGDGDSDADTSTGTGPIECDLGTYSGSFEANSALELAELAGYTAISGWLRIKDCPDCEDLHALTCLESTDSFLTISGNAELTTLEGLGSLETVGGGLSITTNTGELSSLEGLNSLTSVGSSLTVWYNPALTSLDGLDALDEVLGSVSVEWNGALPDCEVCDLLEQLESVAVVNASENLEDDCTPVPDACPEPDAGYDAGPDASTDGGS